MARFNPSAILQRPNPNAARCHRTPDGSKVKGHPAAGAEWIARGEVHVLDPRAATLCRAARVLADIAPQTRGVGHLRLALVGVGEIDQGNRRFEIAPAISGKQVHQRIAARRSS